MESVKQGLRSLVKEPNNSFSNKASSSSSSNNNFSTDQSRILLRRTQGQVVSVSTCAKLCTVGFIVGVVVGYTLKRRVRRWAAKLLKRMKDD